MQHDVEACGPIGLIIRSIVRCGLKIDRRFNIWQDNEEPINILKTPYQHLQSLIAQAAARARTKAAWYHKRDLSTRLSHEIDKQASAINNNLTNEERASFEPTSAEGES